MVALAVTCQHSQSHRLGELELAVETNPDSVYGILQKCRKESMDFNMEDRMRYGLLRLKCQNILDLSFDAEDTVKAIADYYQRRGSYNEALLATYLLGRSYMVSGNETMAIECFNNCLDLKPSSRTDVDYVQLSKVHSQLDNIYRNQNLVQFELQELKAAENCAKMGGDSLLALTYNYLRVNPYFKLGDMDSVIQITEEVRKQYLSLGMQERAAEVLYMSIDAYLLQKKYDKARSNMAVFERESGVFDSLGNIESGREIYYFVKGRLFEAVGQVDSAQYQYRRLLRFKHDINNLEAGYKGLLSLYRTIGNRDSIGKYADLYCEANDSAHAKSRAAEIARLKAMYDYSSYKQKAEELRLQSEIAEKKYMLFAVILFFIIIGVFYKINLYRKKKQLELCCLMEDYDRTLQIIEGLKEDKEEMLRKHQAELESITVQLKDKGLRLSEENPITTISEELLTKFQECADQVIGGTCSVTAEDWHRLLLEMAKIDSKFMLLLSASGLTDKEKRIAVLIRMRFSDYQIKRIFDSYGTDLSNYKARINKKLFSQKGARTLRSLLYAWKG